MNAWHWENPDPRDHPGLSYSDPGAPSLTVVDREETGRIYGPKGETLRVAYDRRYQPFGFST